MESISFDRIADRYDETRGGMDRARDVVRGMAPHLVAGNVLDVGVGTGAVALALRERDRAVAGVDLSEAMLHRAFERIGPSLARADAHQLPVSSGRCPNVVLVWVLHLVGDPAAALREVRRVVTDGGRVIVVLNAPRYAPDDIEPIVTAMRVALLRGRPDPTDVPVLAATAGLTSAGRFLTSPRTFEESPNHAADLIEQRTFSMLWDLEQASWDAVVEPAMASLRALPDADRPRPRSARQEIFVFTPDHEPSRPVSE